MQKTFTIKPYVAAARENGHAVRYELEAPDFRLSSSGKRTMIEMALKDISDGALMFFKEDNDRPLKQELRFMEDELWFKLSHVLAEGESKVGQVTRSYAKGYCVNVVMIDADFNEYEEVITGLKEDEITDDYLASKYPCYCRMISEPDKIEGTRAMPEIEFYMNSVAIGDVKFVERT